MWPFLQAGSHARVHNHIFQTFQKANRSGDHYLRREDSIGQALGQIRLVSQSLKANISCLMELKHTDDISSQTIDHLLQLSHLDVE